jgi:lipid-binding SYLF domain-containing protein
MRTRSSFAVLAAAGLITVGLITAGLIAFPAWAQQDEAAIVQKRNEVREMARESLAALYEVAPGARHAVEHAAGYAAFSTFGIKIFFAGGTTGKGVAVNNRTHRDIFMKLVQVQAGLGLGVKKDRLIFVFETQNALLAFVNQGWEFGGQASAAAMVADQGGTFAGAVSVSPGMYVYQLTESGLSASLTIGATKFFKDDDLH